MGSSACSASFGRASAPRPGGGPPLPGRGGALRAPPLCSEPGLGGRLADDMGLGKAVQVLALLLALKAREEAKPRPSLLVAPASPLADWGPGLERVAPSP